MARPLRVLYPGALYHVTARGNERKPIYRTDADRERFLAVLAQAVERYRLRLHAYVLMNNHYHLLVETQEANLSLALRHLNGVYTGFFNRTHERVGHLFQGRYKAIIVDKASYLLELSRYIHLNPVRTAQRLSLARYPWSSYWDYIGRGQVPAWLTRDVVLGEIGGAGRQAERRYQAFVEAGAKDGVPSPWERVVAQMALGDEQFVASLRRRVTIAPDRDVPSRRQLADRPSWRAIERAVRASAETLKTFSTGRRSDPVRAVLVYLARERGGLSLRDVATLIGREEATVSQHARRVAERRRSDARWDRAVASLEEALRQNGA
jgi:REP element-mobilizing transposase RayT